MKQKYTRFLIIFVVLFQMFISGFSNVYAEKNNASKQPEVCAWPSDTMQEYFKFQKEVLIAIVSSNANNGKVSVSNWDWWLFTRGDLTLPTSALDHVVDSVIWKSSSIVSTTATSVALLSLASASVIQSDAEWLAILSKDRPIVRDYKKLLDIETEIFETAFSLSKTVDLTRSVQGNTVSQVNAVIKKYQASWLLRKWLDINSSVSIKNILTDLVSMNASMKFFMAVWWEVWASELRSYIWCMWQSKYWSCEESNLVLWFDLGAVDKLKEEYKGIWAYWACNSFWSNFINSLSKWAKNNWDTVKSAWTDNIKPSLRNLKNALLWEWTENKTEKDPCGLSDYEKAQLTACYWWNWSCWDGSNVQSLIAECKKIESNKKALASQSEETDDLSKWASSSQPPSLLDVMNDLNKQETTEKRNLEWYRIYSGETRYNTVFSNDMNNEFTVIFDEITEQFGHSQRAVMASDLSYELIKFKWLSDEIGVAMKAASKLRDDLQAIADYQCSGN